MPIALYIHIPFCQAKCAYCDFNSYAGMEGLFEDYTAALVREMSQAGPAAVQTIYIGGGTPSVLPLFYLAQTLQAARSSFAVAADAEVSLEANPRTVDAERLCGLRALGITRLSLGVQSLEEEELRLLGRIHSPDQAVEAFSGARWAGFDNINMDLIYGLPGQSTVAWQVTLDRALALEPEHLSLYALTVEEGTRLATEIADGAMPKPDPDIAAEMYDLAERQLSAAGYAHYEISNWARPAEMACRHNLAYWRNEPYLGIGAGAHSWYNRRRWANVAAPAEYTARVLNGQDPIEAEETIGPELEVGETMMMGLRLLEEGVAFESFRRRFGFDLRQHFAQALAELAELDLIVADQERIRLSQRGHLLANQVFLRFLPG
jgi:oxygen-independent coproporphyrinogen-3 oxidase